MTTLKVFTDHNNKVLFETSDKQEIANALKEVGVMYQEWGTRNTITTESSQEQILQAYQPEIKRLVEMGGYLTTDTINMRADHPQKIELRAKFLSEHTHSEDEVRFFVRGQELFSMHIENNIYSIMCNAGDLISVPANTPHWFDMGEEPNFTCIRMFNNQEGWVAKYTGSDISQNYPTYHQF